MRIYLAGDHAAFELKKKIAAYLKARGYTVRDFGPYAYDPEDDYPDFIIPAVKAVARDKKSLGIAVCGSGDGACIAANKVRGARAVQVWDTKTAHSSRWHNNANVLCLPGGKTKDVKTRGVSFPFQKITLILEVWLSTPFSGAPRHQRRLAKIKKFELRGKL
ncbi:RpiB/LacA/LacB family sugar-phosphate isomerase [Candidatus Uhrbacteria bacterium]|nr:RpiB/LacA/LacB family sugar-phosphate isomerase [Candidatus Uhrbacteria bacterium]